MRRDPFFSHIFDVEIDGMYWGSFQEVGGLSGSNEIHEIKEGGLNYQSRKFVTRTTFGDITLKYGFIPDRSLFWWFGNTALFTNTERYDGRITMKMGEELDDTASWNFYNAFPLKWDGPAMNATSSALAIETLTLACEFVEYDGS